MKKQDELMGLSGAIFTGIGASIGVALVAYIGFVIAYAGKASIISVFIGLVIGLLASSPVYFLTKGMVITGSQAQVVETGLGRASSAFISYTCVLQIGFLSTYPASIASYVISAFPALTSYRFTLSFLVLILCISVLCFGVKFFERASKLFSALLLIGLITFALLGLIKVVGSRVNPFDFSADPIFQKNGINGVLAGVPVFAGTCGGYANIGYMGGLVKEPKKNVPKAILVSAAVMIFFWIFLTIVAANVLPVEQVAGQPLTYVARELMPEWMALFFVLAGPTMAIVTTFIPGMQINATTIGITASQGMLPRFLAPKDFSGGINRRVILIMGGIMSVILLLGLPVNVIVGNIAPYISFASMLIGLAYVGIAFRHSEIFESKRDMAIYRGATIAGTLASLLLFILSVRAITFMSAIINITAIICTYVFCTWKIRRDAVKKAEDTVK